MLNDQELKEKLATRTAPSVSKSYIEDRISDVTHTKIGSTVTVTQITLDNCFSVRGESACVNAENYDQQIGERISYDNAFNQLWPLFGFLLAENQHKTPQSKAA